MFYEKKNIEGMVIILDNWDGWYVNRLLKRWEIQIEFKGLDFEAILVKEGQFGVVDVEEIAEGLSIKDLALEKNTAGIEN